jgi:hypothetical protein
MTIDAPYPLSIILELGCMNLLVVGNGDQCPFLFLSTFLEFKTLDFPTSNGDSPLFSPLSFLLKLKALLLLAMANPFLLSHLSQSF